MKDELWQRHIDYARRLLDQLEAAGPKLFARDRESAHLDGFPRSSMGGDGRGGGDGTSSTENAALGNVEPDYITRDEVHDDALALRNNLDEAINALQRGVNNTTHAAVRAIDLPKDHGPGGTCQACLRDVKGTAVDRLRASYCGSCYKAWDRLGRPDRFRFERERRQEAA